MHSVSATFSVPPVPPNADPPKRPRGPIGLPSGPQIRFGFEEEKRRPLATENPWRHGSIWSPNSWRRRRVRFSDQLLLRSEGAARPHRDSVPLSGPHGIAGTHQRRNSMGLTARL